MARRTAALASILLAAAALAAGCGGSQPGPPSRSTVAVTASATSTTPVGGATGKPSFPPKVASDVLDLATNPGDGRVSYAVKSGAASYTLELTRLGSQLVLHQSQAEGAVWISTTNGVVDWVCKAAAGASPTCTAGDPTGQGAKVGKAIGKLFDPGFLKSAFGAAASLPQTGVGQDTQSGEQVGCMAVTSGGTDLRLCADQSGRVTELTAGKTQALAKAITPTVSTTDVQPPAPLQ